MASTVGPGINVRVHLAPDLPQARADANQLEMALLNLGVNARDAMPNGGTSTIAATHESIEVGHMSKLTPGHYVGLSVSDTGLGMDEVTRAHAIEPFFSTQGIGKGTGLGLSMVHGLVAQLGGALCIDSELGTGTSIKLWLPVSADRAEANSEESLKITRIASRGLALLIDDDDLVRLSVADMLVDLGYVVTEANSAEHALSIIAHGLTPDLIVTDHLMSGMNGVELAQQVRLSRPHMPILVVSGYAEVDGIASDLPRLTKPFRTADLALALSRLF